MQVDPAAQTVLPVYPTPPHWPYRGTVLVLVGMLSAVDVEESFVAVKVVAGFGVVEVILVVVAEEVTLTPVVVADGGPPLTLKIACT